MKIYKVAYDEGGESRGFFYAPSLQKAKRNKYVDGHDITDCAKKIYEYEIKPTRTGIIDALNRHASHNDNG